MTTAHPPIVTHDEWTFALADLEKLEQAAQDARAAANAARKRLPMVKIDKEYTFESADGPVSLRGLFGDRTQLIVQHFMFDPSWDAGCPFCSAIADNVPPLVYLRRMDTEFVRISRAPLEKIQAYNDRMGWEPRWVSSFASDFNDDLGITVDGQELGYTSVFFRIGDDVYRSYVVSPPVEEIVYSLIGYLDITPFGRQDADEDAPAGWPKGNFLNGKRRDEITI